MKALTLHQPYGTAIIYGGKTIENRTTLWSHRGPLAIHAGLATVETWTADPLLREAVTRWRVDVGLGPEEVPPHGVILGVVDVVDAHREAGRRCCAPWGQRTPTTRPGKPAPRGVVHLVLTNPRPLSDPIPARGSQGLWSLDADTEALLHARLTP